LSASDERQKGEAALPTYQYSCTECGHFFEQFQSFSEESLSVCPECEGRLRKVFNAVGVVFKGSGFYRTDSRAATESSSGGSKDGGSKDGGSKDGGSKDGGSKKPEKATAASTGTTSSTSTATSAA
jgi:putative FmdB family regulatory protein